MKTEKKELSIVLIGLLIALLTLTVSCDCTDDEYMSPSTDIANNGVSEIRDLEGFHSISAAIVGKIFLTQGTLQEVTLEGVPGILYAVGTTVIDGVLEMKFAEAIAENRKVGDFTARITVPEIRSLDLLGVGELIAQNDLQAETLIINRTGVSNITLRGETNHLEITSTGIGIVNAFDMTSKSCNVLTEGFGNVEVTVIEDLSASLTGFGSVFYKGHPTITSNITGAGRLVNAN